MPELPEVERLARELRRLVVGSRLGEVRCFSPTVVAPGPEALAAQLPGCRVEQVARHGKYLFVLLSPLQLCLVVHLRMTGQLMVVPRARDRDKHTHLEIDLGDRQRKLIYRDVRKLGKLQLTEESRSAFIGRSALGPDALEIDARRLGRALARTRRAIKAALLDQRLIAGLGNIYTDEILFREGISPLRPAAGLSGAEVASLLATVRAVLRAAIRSGGTTIADYRSAEGRPGAYQHLLRVYGREGLPCPTCGTPVAKIRVAGRGTWYCPSCQKG